MAGKQKATFPATEFSPAYYIEDHSDPSYTDEVTWIAVGQGGAHVVSTVDVAIHVTLNEDGEPVYSGPGVTNNPDGSFTLNAPNVTPDAGDGFTVSY